MYKSDPVRNSLLYLFLTSTLISIALYVYLYVFRKSGATGLRILFTLLTISAGSIIVYYCSGIYTSRYKLFSILGLLITICTFLICLFAIWLDASFFASNWKFIEICIALSLLSGVLSFILKTVRKLN